MKFNTALPLLSLAVASSACTLDNVEFTSCDLADVLIATECDVAGLTSLLNGVDAASWVSTQCAAARREIKEDMLPWDRVTMRGRQFDDTFFDGGSIFNTGPIEATDMLDDLELSRIKDIKDFVNPNAGIGWPSSYHKNFDLETCDSEAVMCCWKATRLGTDPNAPQISSGNANICHHDIADSPKSARVAGGTTVFLERAEGESVCHGFFWDGDSVNGDYKGNLLFYVAMEHGLINNGFVRNVPSAPMCACIEQMPKVSNAGCSDVSVVETFKVTYESLTSEYIIEQSQDPQVTFSNCGGKDLKTAYEEVKPTELTKITGDDTECDNHAEAKIKEFGFARTDPTENWVPIAGRGPLAYPILSNEEVIALMNQSKTKIIRRKCIECDLSHADIYYKRLDEGDLPSNFDLQNTLLDRWVQGEHNRFNIDFELYNDYDAAVAGDTSKRWTYCNFHSTVGFPRDCGPTKYTPNQWNRFYSGSSKAVGFFVDMSDGPTEIA